MHCQAYWCKIHSIVNQNDARIKLYKSYKYKQCVVQIYILKPISL